MSVDNLHRLQKVTGDYSSRSVWSFREYMLHLVIRKSLWWHHATFTKAIMSYSLLPPSGILMVFHDWHQIVLHDSTPLWFDTGCSAGVRAPSGDSQREKITLLSNSFYSQNKLKSSGVNTETEAALHETNDMKRIFIFYHRNTFNMQTIKWLISLE